MELTPRQKAFADEWLINGGNDYQAAIKAGYSKSTAKNARKNILENHGVSKYIAEKQEKIEKEKGYDIMSLAEIQARRSKIAKGEVEDSFGFAPDFSEQLKAMDSLEKHLTIKAAEEEKKRIAEEALMRKTYHMDLYDIPDTFHATARAIRDGECQEFIEEGGRGSTKSTFFAMMGIELMRNYHDIHWVVVRKVGNTLKDSVYSKVKWAIGKQEFTEEFDALKSPLEITLKATGQKIYFRGADDPAKIKSITPEFGYIAIVWFEELDQFTEEEVRNITQSVIRGGEKAWIFKSFNPPRSKNNWANMYVKIPKENMRVHHSTYLDVPRKWLGQPFIDEAEHLKEVNPVAYEHEYLGEANGNGGNVFEYLEIRTITDEEIAKMDRIYQGVDWGWYPDIFAFKRLYVDVARKKIYHIAEITGNKLKNEKTAQMIKDAGFDDYMITCDSAEPKSINDFKDAGLPARGAIKGPGSVEYGMKFLQGYTHVIDQKRTPVTYKEYTEYEYERDKEGNVISGYPDKNNHTIDADRYALENFYNKRGTSA